jgi:hypothetical protein
MPAISLRISEVVVQKLQDFLMYMYYLVNITK